MSAGWHGLTGLVDVYTCDTQGPFDIACLALGHDIFYEVYDDPDFVHHLMRQATHAYQAVTRVCKTLQGESETSGNAAGLWLKRGGVRVCDDSGILLARDSFAEFVLPYLKQALDAFDGGWLHYCGGVPEGGRAEGIHLHDLYFQIPTLRGINFTTGKDWEAEIRKCHAHCVTYVGWLPRRDDESLDAYFTRLAGLIPDGNGMVLQFSPRPGEMQHAQAAWHRALDAVRGKKA